MIPNPHPARTRAAPFAAPLAAFAFLLLSALAGCSFDYGADAPGAEDRPDAVFRGFSRQEITGNALGLEARAERAEYYADAGRFVLFGLGFEEYDPGTGAPRYRGQAERAEYFEDTDDAEFSGYIRLESLVDDASFETDRLRYIGATNTIEGAPETAVIVRVGEKLVMRGRGLFADIGQRIFTLRGGADGVINGR